MPRSTFCRLAPEKQERLLEAATREFSHRSFAEASINQIIKDAGIPRGSFYMYFDDKEDLFCYVMSGYVDQLLMVVRESVLRAGGDLFQGMLDLYDFLLRQGRGQEPGGHFGLQQRLTEKHAAGAAGPGGRSGRPGGCGGPGYAGPAP